MCNLRRTQLNEFFEACLQEFNKVKRDYTIDIDNDTLMFEQEFDGLQERIDRIENEINQASDFTILSKKPSNHSTITTLGNQDNETEQDLLFSVQNSLNKIMNNIHQVIEAADGYEVGDYLISYNREDLRDRVQTL